MSIDNLIPIGEYAARIKRDPATVRQKILRGALPGAVKLGRARNPLSKRVSYLHTVLHTTNGTKSTIRHDWHSVESKQKALNPLRFKAFRGTPAAIRTHGLQSRSFPTLCTESVIFQRVQGGAVDFAYHFAYHSACFPPD